MDAQLRARLSIVVFVLMALVSVTGVHVGADEAIPDEPAEEEWPSELVCEGLIQVLHNDYVPEAEMRGAPPNTRAALARFLSFDHGYLRADDFRQTRGTATSAHFVHDATGKPQVTADVERYGDGWLVMELAACNTFLEQEDGQ